MNRQRLWLVGRLTLSAAALAAIAWRVDVAETWGVLRDAQLGYVAAGFALNGLGVALSTLLWRTFLLPPRPRFVVMLRAYFHGLFLNNLGLGTIIGDVSRVSVLRQHSATGGARSILAERFVSFASLIGLAAVGAIGWFAIEPLLAMLVLTLVFAVMVLFAVAMLFASHAADNSGLPASLRTAGRWLIDVRDDVTRDRPRFARALLLGCGVQATTIASTFMMFSAVGGGPGAWAVISLTPIVALAVLLPLSIQGIGVREATYVSIFGLASVAPSVALGAALLSYVSTVALSLLGAVSALHGFADVRRTEQQAQPAISAQPGDEIAA